MRKPTLAARLLAGLACSIPLTLAPHAHALGTRIVDHDADATARAEAFVATADNPSAISYNPAGITQLPGVQFTLGSYAVEYNTHIGLDGVKNSFDNKYDPQFAPHFFATWQLPKATAITLGLGFYVPFGFSNKYEDDVPFRQLAKEGTITYLTLNPVVAIKITRSLSIAFGPTLNYGEAELVRGVFARGDEFRFKGDDFAIGGNAGLLWQPHPMHSFGITYFSPTTMDFEGHSHLKYDGFTTPVEVAPGVVVPFPVPGADTREKASAKFRFPQHVTFGYSFRPTPDWNLEFDVDWTDWDNLNSVTLEQKSGNVVLPFNWQSSFIYEFGITRKFGDWRVNAGYAFSETSVPRESFNPLVPDTDRHILAVGIGRKWDHFDASLAYQHTWSATRNINEGTLADGSYRFSSHALTLSLTYRF